MWYPCTGETMPKRIEVMADRTLIRRNVEYVEEQTMTDEATGDEIVTPPCYTWEELSVPKHMWAICQPICDHSAALNDVYAALTELAEIITEG